ncbi:MAG: GNAT family N-acetyltransferase, partial [Bdellovibrionales bacterium]|nr:GNAT family N-acetyltransferase [Bdellovibrionales bacterium]
DGQAFLEGLDLFSDMDSDWYSFIWEEGMTHEKHLEILENRFYGKNLPEGLVPDSMLYAFLDGKIIGRSSIRHDLNDFLFNFGGHIGYAVATTYRNRGFATEILSQSLNFCRDILKMDRVLLTCDETNTGSIKTILKNGGVLENKVLNVGKSVHTNRYWINLTERVS